MWVERGRWNIVILVSLTRRETNIVLQSGPRLTTGEQLSGDFLGERLHTHYHITLEEKSHISPFRLRIHLDKDEGNEGGSTLLVRLKALVITLLMLTVVFLLLSMMIYLFSFLNWLGGSGLDILLMWLLFYNLFILYEINWDLSIIISDINIINIPGFHSNFRIYSK